MSESSILGTTTEPLYTPTSDEKNIALLSHLLTFIAPILAPLIIWLVKKDESAFIAAHAKESLNFQITIVIIAIALLITVIGILFLWIFGIFATILVVVAIIRASEGKLYRYPFNIRIVS